MSKRAAAGQQSWMRKPRRLVSGDMGNAQIKAVSDDGRECVFPHALIPLSDRQIEEKRQRDEENSPSIFTVNGIPYSVGEKAVLDGAGAVRIGEGRYEELYYGTLAAISLFKLFDSDQRVYWYGSHTPKDIVYREDLRMSVLNTREWVVESQGITRRFYVEEAKGFDEPTGLYRHATLSDTPGAYSGWKVLREGECLVIDIGGYTTAFTVAYNGRVDYDASRSYTKGILHVLEDFEKLIRTNNKRLLKGTNVLNPIKLRSALKSGSYDAGLHGAVDVRSLVDQACNPLLRQIEEAINNYGGIASFNSILVGGGGGGLLEGRLRKRITDRGLYVSEENRDRIHLSTAMGGMKVLRTLEASGKL